MSAYRVDLAVLMHATENHPDPQIRAVRKIVAPAAQVLDLAHKNFQPGQHSDDNGGVSVPLTAVLPKIVEPTPGLEPHLRAVN